MASQRVVESRFDRIQAHNNLTVKNNSQMSKIADMMSSNSPSGPSDEDRLTRLALKASKLTVIQTKLKRLTVALADLPSLEQKAQLKKLTAARKALELLLEEDPPSGVSKILARCINEMTSLREGVYIGASTKRSFVLLAVGDAITQLGELGDKTQATTAALKARMAEAAGTGVDEQTEEVIRRSAKEQAKIPSFGKRDYVVARTAVIPIMQKMIPSEILIPQLKRQGFNADNIAGYPAIHNQLVIGIQKGKLGKRATPLEAAQEVMRLVEQSTGKKLSLVTDRSSGYQNASWFWVAPRAELQALVKAFSGHLQIKQWGFAFMRHGGAGAEDDTE